MVDVALLTIEFIESSQVQSYIDLLLITNESVRRKHLTFNFNFIYLYETDVLLDTKMYYVRNNCVSCITGNTTRLAQNES